MPLYLRAREEDPLAWNWNSRRAKRGHIRRKRAALLAQTLSGCRVQLLFRREYGERRLYSGTDPRA